MITAGVLSAPVNLRDLGGTPVAGGVIRDGVVVRADDLALVTPAVADELVDGGLRAVIDLRSPEELAYTGRGPLAAHGLGYHHVPFMANMTASLGRDSSWRDPSQFGRSYAGLIETAAPAIVAAVGVIATTPGAVAFHCAAGKDRTGVLAAVVLTALGADHDVVVADYDRTGENYPAITARLRPSLGGLWSQLGVDLDATALAAGADVFSYGAIGDTLGALRERHGDPLAPLRAAGLSDALVGALRDRVVV